jgi:hypothetical protein
LFGQRQGPPLESQQTPAHGKSCCNSRCSPVTRIVYKDALFVCIWATICRCCQL